MRGSLSTSVLVATLAGAMAMISPTAADACGGFFRRRATKEVTVPSLEVEQVLIIHDPASEEEHFIREIVFRDAKEPFGFVVPVPSQPTVAKLDTSPFAALAARFPPEPPEPMSTGGGAPGSRGIGAGSGGGGAPQQVTVLSQERIGSFTAFVLAATDAGALKKWLDDNELVTTPESTAWLEHYVTLGFYFAAFRYEVSAKASTSKSETIRISFKTPLPYYPYREPAASPDASKNGPATKPRVLAVWFVSPERSVPIATVTDEEGARWKRPWTEPMKHPATRAGSFPSIAGLAPLLPPAEGVEVDEQPGIVHRGEALPRQLFVQTFLDQKTSRRGWGDIVLVPAKPRANAPARLERMKKLMVSLDPALIAPEGMK